MKPLQVAVVILLLALAGAWPAVAQQRPPDKPPAKEGGSTSDAERRIDELLASVVRVKVRALPDARSNATLGPSREGSGIVIERGYVLTIGYLVIEPDSIEVTSVQDKTLPATLAGYDHVTGFGLLRVQGDLGVKPIELGESAALGVRESVIIVPHGGRDTASLARVMAKRQFTGSWEYLIENAIFTAPATMTWSGAALVNRELKLVGVGSLFVRYTGEPGAATPGNMFVPIDLLKPILTDLKANGRARAAPRPWLGLATEEVQGHLFVTRVSPESPAERAGLRHGDIVIGVGDDLVKTHAELYRKVWGLGAAGVDVPLKILQGSDVRDVRVRSIDRFDYFKVKPAY